LGIAFGMGISLFMGYTVSFLSFTTLREPVPVSFQGLNWYLIGAGLAVAVLARLIPAVRTARMSIVEAERGRQVQKPFWQRAYLDFLLVVPTWYAYDQLANEGTFANMVQERTAELFSDPLLILVPALFVLTCSLLVMRIFPILMWILDRIAGWTNLLTTHLALRQLERHSQRYINPLLLVIVSLSLGIYTYSMALSLDQWLIDQVRHEVGAGATFEPFIPPSPDSSGGSGPIMDGTGTWIPTVAEFEALPGVTTAARVGNYNAELEVTGGDILRLDFMAVDRIDFAEVAWFREDFADDSLGGLMNRLALSPNSILVPRALMGPLNWREGDEVGLEVSMARGHAVQDQFVIVGTYDQFATIYHQPWTVIGNMDHLFSLAGTDFAHNIWMGVDESVESIELKQAIRRMGIEPTRWRHVPTRIVEEQARMERVGIFGTLSVGFLAAAAMAFLALLVHSYASLQDRMFQFGVLRAVGVMRSQIIGQITIEYIFLTSYGTIAGAVIGSLCSILFSPFFRVTAAVRNPLPPLVPLIAENEIAILAAVFAAAIVLVEVSVTFQALTRRLFDALRMGYQE
jgi:putative ABC transport system permease protein